MLTRGGGDVKQIAIAVVAPKAKCWVRLASPSWSSLTKSLVSSFQWLRSKAVTNSMARQMIIILLIVPTSLDVHVEL